MVALNAHPREIRGCEAADRRESSVKRLACDKLPSSGSGKRLHSRRERTILRNNVTPMKRLTWEQSEGSSLPLGVSWIEAEQAFNFAIHSEHAESVTRCSTLPRSGEPAADVPF